MGSIRDVRLYERLAERFESEKGIRVEITPLTWGNFLTKYFTAMAAGLPPDVGVTNLGGPNDYGVVGGLVDLREAFPDEIEELESKFFEDMLPMFTFGDKLFGLPTDVTTLVMFYRSDVFDRLGLEPPRTWSELNRAIQTLQANGYRFFFGFTNRAQWALGIYTMPFGLSGSERLPDGSIRVNWTEPRYLDGVAQALDLWHMHDSPDTDIGGRVMGLFRTDDRRLATPLVIDLHTFYSQIPITAPELEGRWGVAAWPRADDGKPINVMGGTSYVIFRDSERHRESFEWIKFLNSVEVQQEMILDRLNRGDESSLLLSPVKAIWAPENADFWNRPELRTHRRLKEVVAQVLPTMQTLEPIRGGVEASRIEGRILDRMGSFIQSEMARLGAARNMGRWEHVQAMARGEAGDDREVLVQRVRERLEQEYRSETPRAEAILAKETLYYQERYGNVIADLARWERQSDVLDVAKWTGFAAGLGAFLFVLSRSRLRKHLSSYAFVGLPIVLALTFVFVPAAVALYLSLTEYHPVLPLSSARFVGMANYEELLRGGEVVSALLRTGFFVLATLPTGIAIALLLAFLLNQKAPAERFWRFLYFSPLVTSVVSISLIFTQLFMGSELGWLNGLLLSLGVVQDPVMFLSSDRTFLWSVVILAVWHGLAFTILVFLAGLQQIPGQLYEAAEVDGAKTIDKFWNISLPGLRPQLLFVAVLGLIGGFQVFEPIYMLGGGAGEAGARFGPNESGMTMVPLVFHTGFETFEMGRASAIAYILFAVILVFTLVQLHFYSRRGADS